MHKPLSVPTVSTQPVSFTIRKLEYKAAWHRLTAFSVWCVVTDGLTAWAPSSPGNTLLCVAVAPSSSSFFRSSSSRSSSSTRGSCVRSHNLRERSCPPLITHIPRGHTARHLWRVKQVTVNLIYVLLLFRREEDSFTRQFFSSFFLLKIFVSILHTV